jgi:hypothetical protein
MIAESTASMQHSAAIAGRGTGFSVTDNIWTRVLTEDGRVYYYNRATGSSQWHLPNDMYQSSTASKSQASQQGTQATVVWPTHAKATLCVDCVTEVLPEQMLDAGLSIAGTSAANAIAAIQADPRSMQNLGVHLPKFLSEFLQSDEFELTCKSVFQHQAVTQGLNTLSLEANFDAVSDIVLSIQTEPPLQLGSERFARLVESYDEARSDAVDEQDFVQFMRFTVAMRYLEQAAGTAGL